MTTYFSTGVCIKFKLNQIIDIAMKIILTIGLQEEKNAILKKKLAYPQEKYHHFGTPYLVNQNGFVKSQNTI